MLPATTVYMLPVIIQPCGHYRQMGNGSRAQRFPSKQAQY
jgi:hypothetical protein